MIGRSRIAWCLRLLAVAATFCAWQSPLRAQDTARSGWFRSSDGVRLHYLEAGGSGPTLVLVPGWTMPARIWERQIRDLSRDHHVVALDPRSQGESQQTAEGNHLDRRARDVADLVLHLRRDSVVLVGWSLGAVEALVAVDRQRLNGVIGLVLVDGYLGADSAGSGGVGLGPMLRSLQQDRRAFAGAMIAGMFQRPQPKGFLDMLLEQSLRTPTSTAVTVLADLTFGPGHWRDELRRLELPLLYVARPALSREAGAVQRLVREARVEIFEAGHGLFVDEPDRFNGLIRDFSTALRRG